MILRSAEVGHPTSVRVEIREGSYRDMYLHWLTSSWTWASDWRS
jgi:hypothetical protein